MKVYTMRIHLSNGQVIDKLSTTRDKDQHIKEYLANGLRTSDGSCLIIYPARLIERIEVYEQGSAPPLGQKKRKPRPKANVRGEPNATDDLLP